MQRVGFSQVKNPCGRRDPGFAQQAYSSVPCAIPSIPWNHKLPLVEGIVPAARASGSSAMRSARPKALNTVSH